MTNSERPRVSAPPRRCGTVGTGDGPALDELVELAARCCAAPIAVLSFITDDNTVRIESQFGLTAAQTAACARFCATVLIECDVTVVPDAAADHRFADERPIGAQPALRFYAGLPVIAPSGDMIGALCVVDHVPRTLTSTQEHDLRVLGRQVEAQLELRRRTSQLSDRERLLATMFDSEPECVKLLGPDGSIRMMNRAGLGMLEADSLEQVVGRSILPFVADEHQDAFRTSIDQVFRGERVFLEFEAAGLKKGRRWLETHAVPLHDEQGAVVALLGITRDVTDHKRADAALRESEKKFRALFEQATDGIFVTDPQGRFLDVNHAGCQLTGYSHDELVQLSVADLIVADQLPQLMPEIRRLAGGQTVTTEWQGQRKNGTHFMSEVTAKRLPDGRLQAFARDVTQRRLAEMALRESESRLRQAVHAGRVGLWDWDLQTNKVYYSSEWKRQIGFQDHEVSDGLDEWLRRVHPDDRDWLLERVHSFLAGDAPDFEVEFRFRHKDGSYRQILTHGSKVFDERGRATRVLGSHVDVTERTALYAQFLQAQKMESVGRLAGGIAHDFNNLLTVINGMADLAISSMSEHEVLRPELQEIRLAGDRAAKLTRQLLAMSRQQILKPEVLNLNAVVAQMENMLRRLLGEDISLVQVTSPDLENIKADPGQIEQVIMNLAVNARDAMPDGGSLTIETRNVSLDAAFAAAHPSVVPGDHVMLEVTDTGTGMDEATRKRVFEPFFTTKEVGKGTGLGLSTVYGIVKQSGGTVWVSSAPGQGTAFEIYFPRVGGVLAGEATETGAVASSGTETILLVEDERPLRDLSRRILASAGYTVLEAGSGQEALSLLRETNEAVHLIVTDVVMPGINGRELAVRVADSHPAVKVLYMSGYADDAIGRHGVLDDAARFMSKPFTPAELKKKVREMLDH